MIVVVVVVDADGDAIFVDVNDIFLVFDAVYDPVDLVDGT